MQRATRKKRTKRSEIGNSLWESVSDEWMCPACDRSKQQILRKSKKALKKSSFSIEIPLRVASLGHKKNSFDDILNIF